MIHLFYGSNYQEKHSAIQALCASVPNTAVVRLDTEACTRDHLTSLIREQNLFGERYVFILPYWLGEFDMVQEYLTDLQASSHYFVFSEEELPVKVVRAFEKVGATTTVFETSKEQAPQFPIFSLTDALGRRDDRKLWELLQNAWAAGVDSQEILSILVWQLRSILIVFNERPKTMKPFVVKKTQAFTQNFTRSEAEIFLHQLTVLFHLVRRGEASLDEGLECFILSIQKKTS